MREKTGQKEWMDDIADETTKLSQMTNWRVFDSCDLVICQHLLITLCTDKYACIDHC